MPTNFETFQLVPVSKIPADNLYEARPVIIPDSSGWKYFNPAHAYPSFAFDALTGKSLSFPPSDLYRPDASLTDFADQLPYKIIPPSTGIAASGLMAASTATGQGWSSTGYAGAGNGPGYSLPYVYAFINGNTWIPCAIYLDGDLSYVGFNKFQFTTSTNTPCGISTNSGGVWGAHMLGYRVDASFIYACVGIMDLVQNQTPASHIGVWKLPFGQSNVVLKAADALYFGVGPLPPPAPASWYSPGISCGGSGALPIFSRAAIGSPFYMADAAHSLTWCGGGVTHGAIGFLVKSGTAWNLVTPSRTWSAPPSIQAWLDRMQAVLAWQFDGPHVAYYTLTLQILKNGFPRLTVGYTPPNYYGTWQSGTPAFFTTASWAILDWQSGAVAEYPYGTVIAENPLFPLAGGNNTNGVALCGARENGVFCGVARGTDTNGYYFEIHRTYAKGHSSTAYQFNLASLLKG